jgi:HD-like signal output (HDOD) protein
MTQEIFYKILSDHKELSSLPQVLTEVVRVSSDPKSSANDLAAVILKDPSLTARLLRAVNSPHYGPIAKITTVNQAVVILGLRTVTAIALSSSIYDKLNKVESSIDRKRFWRHSLEVAIASKMISEATGYQPAEEAFVAGLLHDIGILVLEASFPVEFKRIWKLVEMGENQLSQEERAWGTNHARIGQFLLDQWGVPKIIGQAVGSHHALFPADDKRSERLLPQIIALANQISRFRIYSMPPPESRILENRDVIAANLGLSNAAISRFEEDIISRVINESGYLEIEIGSVEELLREANRLLYKQYIAVENLLRENRIMHQQITRDQLKRAALESLKTLAGAFGRYLEQAVDAISERINALDAAVAAGDIADEKGIASLSSETISEALRIIATIQEEMKKMTAFESNIYVDENYVAQLEAKIADQIKSLTHASAVAGI